MVNPYFSTYQKMEIIITIIFFALGYLIIFKFFNPQATYFNYTIIVFLFALFYFLTHYSASVTYNIQN